MLQADGWIRFAPLGVSPGFYRISFIRFTCGLFCCDRGCTAYSHAQPVGMWRCSVFMSLLGHKIAALVPEPYARTERTWVTTSNTRCTSLRCFLSPSLQERRRRRKTRRGHRNSRGQWSPARAARGRTDVDVVVHRRRRGPPLDDGARASCRVGPHTMHCVTLGRRRAALKWSRISCSKSDFFVSFLPTCGCR
jgi:hypothetical protein